LPEPLAERGAGERLRVEMEMTAKLRARATGDGKGLVLEGRGNTVSYSGLKVTDAGGREFEARMKVAGRKVLYEIADEGAEYPLDH
jgi:hypothetical protein